LNACTRAVYIALFLSAGAPHSLQAKPPADAASITISPASIEFGTQTVGSAAQPQTATVTNTGSSAVTIRDILTSGIDFAQSNTCGSALEAGVSCAVELTFKPAIPGARLGALYIVDSDPGSPHMVRLTGTGQ